MILTSPGHFKTLSGSGTLGNVKKARITFEVDTERTGIFFFDLLNTPKIVTFVYWLFCILATQNYVQI